MIMDTDSVMTSSYPFITMIAVTLAVTIPTQSTDTKAIITLQTMISIMINEKQSEMAIP